MIDVHDRLVALGSSFDIEEEIEEQKSGGRKTRKKKVRSS
jgi:hypothetical protein